MQARTERILTAATALVAGAGALLVTGARGTPEVSRVDFGVTRTALTPAYDARVPPAGRAPVKEFRIPMTHDTVEIAGGVRYVGWTFGATVPGPVLRVRQGDLVRVTW